MDQQILSWICPETEMYGALTKYAGESHIIVAFLFWVKLSTPMIEELRRMVGTH